jgi:hypothetical protein
MSDFHPPKNSAIIGYFRNVISFVGFTCNLHIDAVSASHHVWHFCEKVKKLRKPSQESASLLRYEQTDGTLLVRSLEFSWCRLTTDLTKQKRH